MNLGKKITDELVGNRLTDLQIRLAQVLDQTKEKNKDFPIEKQAKYMGIFKSNLTKYARDEDPPIMGVDKLIRICEYFDVSADYMLGLTSDPKLMRRCTPNESAIKQMCDYTGLTRQAIEALHEKKEDFLFSAGLTHLLLSKRSLLSSIVEYILTCLHDVAAEDERYSRLPGISSSTEAGKHFFYDIIEELPQARNNFYHRVIANETLRERYSREMALKCVDRQRVFHEAYPYVPYSPELSSEELSNLNHEIENSVWENAMTMDNIPQDIFYPQPDENDPQVIFDNQCEGFLKDLRTHLIEKNMA